jgi:hypothetical protein
MKVPVDESMLLQYAVHAKNLLAFDVGLVTYILTQRLVFRFFILFLQAVCQSYSKQPCLLLCPLLAGRQGCFALGLTLDARPAMGYL